MKPVAKMNPARPQASFLDSTLSPLPVRARFGLFGKTLKYKFPYLTWHHLSCAAVGHLVDQAGLHQRLAYARDLGAAKLDEWRSHDGAWQPSQQHQRFLHAVMHIRPWLGVETAGQRFDAIIQAPGFRKIIGLDGVE